METLKSILAVLACTLISGCETTNTGRRSSLQQSPSPTFVHTFTKFSFPVSVGTFHRSNVQKYDGKGKDIGVGYNSSTPIAATVFVYPGAKDFALLPSPKLENVSEALLDTQFQACKLDILRHHPDAKLIGEGSCNIVQGSNQFTGKKSTYSLGYNFGFASQESVSELCVFLIEPSVKFLLTERYFVKYRITYPLSRRGQAESEVASFMTDLVWPAK